MYYKINFEDKFIRILVLIHTIFFELRERKSSFLSTI